VEPPNASAKDEVFIAAPSALFSVDDQHLKLSSRSKDITSTTTELLHDGIAADT
jgi:hypothetical protein